MMAGRLLRGLVVLLCVFLLHWLDDEMCRAGVGEDRSDGNRIRARRGISVRMEPRRGFVLLLIRLVVSFSL